MCSVNGKQSAKLVVLIAAGVCLGMILFCGGWLGLAHLDGLRNRDKTDSAQGQ